MRKDVLKALPMFEKLGKLLCSSNNPIDLVKEIIREVPKVVQVRRVSILLLDKRGLVTLGALGLPEEFSVIKDISEAPVVRWVVDHREPLVVDDISKDPRFCHISSTRYSTSSFVSLPLIDRDHVVGVLNFTERLDGSKFSSEELHLLSIFASHLAFSLRNSLLVRKLKNNKCKLERAVSRLKENIEEIKLLFKLGRRMSKTMDLEVLVKFLVKQVPKIVGVRRASLILRDTGTGRLFILESVGVGKGYTHRHFLKSSPIAEWVIEKKQPLIVNDMSQDTRFSFILRDSYKTSNFLSMPLMYKDEVVGVLSVSDKRDGKVFSLRDQKIFTIFGNQLGVALSNLRLIEELRKTDKLSEEMRIARTIQAQFLPNILPNIRGLSIAARFNSAEEIGGDFYNFIERDDGQFAIFIGDASGKGIPAALMMVLSNSHFCELARTVTDPTVFMKCAHQVLWRYSQGSNFVTAGLALINLVDKKIMYSLAGHHPIIFYKAESDSIIELEEGGLPLGLSNEHDDYPFETINFNLGDRLLFYTDGVTDAKDRENRFFGRAALLQKFSESRKESCDAIVEKIYGAIQDHMTGMDSYDDHTLVCIGF